MLKNMLRKSANRRALALVLTTAIAMVVLSLAFQPTARVSHAGNNYQPSTPVATSRHSEDPLPYKILLPLIMQRTSGIPPTVTALISVEGGTVTLPNYAAVIFPADAFSIQTTVEVAAVSLPEDADFFQQSTAIFDTGLKLGYNIVIHTGTVNPTEAITVALTIPAVFTNTVPSASTIQAFARLWADGGEDILDNFELVDSILDVATKTVEISLHPAFFTDERDAEGQYEAVVTLAAISTTSSHSNVANLQSAGEAESCSCPFPFESAPLRSVTMTSTFADARTVLGTTRPHLGVDLAAANGDDVLAVASGKIILVGTNPAGWGNFVVLKHDRGCGQSLYGHLKDGTSVKQGSRVAAGAKIAEADSTGRVTGPHLHFEYAPYGNVYQKNKDCGNCKRDPAPYLGLGWDLCTGHFKLEVASSVSVINWRSSSPTTVSDEDRQYVQQWGVPGEVEFHTDATAYTDGGGGSAMTSGHWSTDPKCSLGRFISNGSYQYDSPDDEHHYFNGSIASVAGFFWDSPVPSIKEGLKMKVRYSNVSDGYHPSQWADEIRVGSGEFVTPIGYLYLRSLSPYWSAVGAVPTMSGSFSSQYEWNLCYGTLP